MAETRLQTGYLVTDQGFGMLLIFVAVLISC